MMASHFLHTHQFTSHLDKMVWELHSEGKSLREIAKEISIATLSKDGVSKIVHRIQGIMYGR